MPRCVFKFLWDRISTGHEVFAYVKNMARNGDHYWVLAHVTPTYGATGEIIGYHSNRRFPEPSSVAQIEPIYSALLDVEKSHSEPRIALEKSTETLIRHLESNQVTYDEFIFSIIR